MTTQITAAELNELLARHAARVIDASWALDGSDMHAAYLADHIPTAQFFDIDALSDHSTPLPHMAPSPAQFAEAVSRIGISAADHVVVYDRAGLFSAARVWWTFRLMGHHKVQVLGGGLPAWKAAGLPVEADVPPVSAASYYPNFQAGMVIGRHELADAAGRYLVLDARSVARFEGTAPEPRAGLRSGHMPGSRSLPFGELIREGALKPREELLAMFDDLGVAPGTSVVTSCGSGVTAAIISMALEEIGHTQALLYDGSWAEWGQASFDTPVATGPA